MVDWETDLDIAVPTEKFEWLRALLKTAAANATPPYGVEDHHYRGVPF